VADGRGHVAAPLENRLATRSQHFRHEAEFNEGFHADQQQEVADTVRVEKRVQRLAVVLDQRAQIVREQAVEADVSEAKLVVTTMKLRLPIRAEGKDRVTAADGVLPGMR